MKIEDFLYKNIGQFDGFFTHPPLDKRKFYFAKDELIMFTEDGGEVYLGTSNNWDWHTKHKEFRKIVFWYLFQWAFVDWFGVRTHVWHWLLRRQISKYPPEPKALQE